MSPSGEGSWTMPGIFQECLVWMYVCVRIVVASCRLMAKQTTSKDPRPFNDLYKNATLPVVPYANAGMQYSKVPDDTGAGCGARSASMAGRFQAVGVTIRPRTRLSFHYMRGHCQERFFNFVGEM